MSSINRFLSRRDKHSHEKHRKTDICGFNVWIPLLDVATVAVETTARSKIYAGGTIEDSNADSHCAPQPNPSQETLNGLFKDDDARRKSPDKAEEDKIKVISQRLATVGITTFKDADIGYVLESDYAKGDVDKAYELIILLQESEEGIIKSYNPNIKMLGAINRQGVTCYLDALLFAMFARLGSFEAMLYDNFEDTPRKQLATLLRLWVNILRAGELVTVDITKQIQLHLASCGWKEAAELCQQDSSEAFTFITETLALPLLTLKMDIFHTGKEDVSDDHKFINERLLELAVPEDSTDGQPVTLEACLELFFNNKIEVKRYLDDLQRRNTLSSTRSRASVSSIKGNTSFVDIAEIEEGQPSTPIAESMVGTSAPMYPTTSGRPTQRLRAPSIIKESYIDEKRPMMDGTSEGGNGQPRVRKEVMMPAWQFFSLIPWYTNHMPSNDAQVAAHFSSARPILGICLKRYTFTHQGQAVKRTTHVDIPLEIGLPNFIQDDKMAENGPVFGNFKLSLQSVVCHQGNSVDSGHYISIIRNSDLKGEGKDSWLRFDDLAPERVTLIDVELFLKSSTEQTPYLLFYQVIPIEGEPEGNLSGPTLSGDDHPPPSYTDSIISHDSKPDSGVSGVGPSGTGSYTRQSGAPEAIRTSLEYSTKPSPELGFAEDNRRGRRSTDRPSSIVFSESVFQSGPPIKIEKAESQPTSRRGSTLDGPNALSAGRRGSNVSDARSTSKNRPLSSSGENRISRSLSRLAGKMSGSSRDKPTHHTTVAMTAPPSLQIGDYPSTQPPPPPLPIPADDTLRPRQQPEQQEQYWPAQEQQPHPHPEHQRQEPLHSQSQAPSPSLGGRSGGVGPSLTLASETDKASEKARLKKEHHNNNSKEVESSSNSRGKMTTTTTHTHGHNTHLSKAERRAGKPERECNVM